MPTTTLTSPTHVFCFFSGVPGGGGRHARRGHHFPVVRRLCRHESVSIQQQIEHRPYHVAVRLYDKDDGRGWLSLTQNISHCHCALLKPNLTPPALTKNKCERSPSQPRCSLRIDDPQAARKCNRNLETVEMTVRRDRLVVLLPYHAVHPKLLVANTNKMVQGMGPLAVVGIEFR